MKIEIDQNSGFCFGVVYAIEMAEDYLEENGSLYCLGDIVHNDKEVERLQGMGLKIISYDDLRELHDATVLIRAHGEPPETYRIALENNITLIDASCPVVLKLQNRVRNAHDEDRQIVILGKKGHAEVNGLIGQTNQEALVVSSIEEAGSESFRSAASDAIPQQLSRLAPPASRLMGRGRRGHLERQKSENRKLCA